MAEAPSTTESISAEGEVRGRFLVGIDGRDGGRDALELARVIGSATGATISVATVIPYRPLPIPYAILDDEEAGEAGPLFEQAREQLGELAVEMRAFGGGSPAMVITTRAEREEVDLIVVGSPHRGAIGRAVLGSVAQSLLHGAPCAVVVAPRGYAEERHDPFGTIAVAYDGTPESKAALKRAEALALTMRTKVRVLTVVAPLAPLPPGSFAYIPSHPPEPEALLCEAVNSIDSRLAADGRRLDGSPAAKLAEACEEDAIHLLVVGSRGYGPAMRVLLGSVSTQLIHEAPCPVLVVPRP